MDPLVIHVVLTNTLGEAVGRARIDVHNPERDGRDHNNQGPAVYRTKRGRVVVGFHSQWANVATRWTADPEEVAAVFAERDWWLDDDDRSLIDALPEL